MEHPEKELPLRYDKQYGNNLRVGWVSLFFPTISLYFKSMFFFFFFPQSDYTLKEQKVSGVLRGRVGSRRQDAKSLGEAASLS